MITDCLLFSINFCDREVTSENPLNSETWIEGRHMYKVITRITVHSLERAESLVAQSAALRCVILAAFIKNILLHRRDVLYTVSTS